MCRHDPPCPGVVGCRNHPAPGTWPVLSELPGFARSLKTVSRDKALAWLENPAILYGIFYEQDGGGPCCPLTEPRPCHCGKECPGIYPRVHDAGQELREKL